MTEIMKWGRSHEECDECEFKNTEPPVCRGHAPGPVSCPNFKEKEENKMYELTVGYAGFINKSGLEFKDISSEKYREYCYADGTIFRIDNPIMLHVSKSGGHRIYAATESTTRGKCFYIIAGWRAIQWEPRENLPHFVK